MATPIMGRATGDRAAIAAHILARNPTPKLACTVRELVDLFFSEGAAENVRGDIAVFQAIKETGYFAFGGDVRPEQNNYCGLGATGGGVPGLSFTTPQLGVRAQIQHLKAYASTEPLNQAVVDPRFRYVARGVAPNWEDLDGRWAVPGVGYGASIVANFTKVAEAIPPAPDVTSEVADLRARVERLERAVSAFTDALKG